MNQLLEVTLAFEVEVDLPDDLDTAGAIAGLHAHVGTKPFALMRGIVEHPARVVFQKVVISPPFEPSADEFRCDGCRREFSNDEKNINDEGEEICNNCKGADNP